MARSAASGSGVRLGLRGGAVESVLLTPRGGDEQPADGRWTVSGTDSVTHQAGRKGSASDFESLFRSHHTAVLSFCLHRLGNSHDAEDAAQETFARVVSHRGAIIEPLPWLLRTAKHVCLDLVRRRRRAELLLGALQTYWVMTVTEDPADRIADAAEADALLAALTRTERRVVGCTLIDDRSHASAAALLGISASTSRALQTRALSKLRLRSRSPVAAAD